MSYSLNQYSHCNWTATGELECGEQEQNLFEPHTSDMYSGLNRELQVSVYSPTESLSPKPSSFQNSSFQNSSFQNSSFQNSSFQKSIPRESNMSSLQFSNTNMIPTSSQSDLSQIMWSRSSTLYEKFKKKSNIYYFQTPFQKYIDFIQELGQPTMINPYQGGMAIWQNPGLNNKKYKIFKRIDIIDEQCFNSFPYPHIGFLYTHVKLNIPISNLNRVLSISGDIMYDPIKKNLIVRGMSLWYNVALIVLICQYIVGNISWYQIIGNNLVKKMTNYKNLSNLKIQKRNMKLLQTYIK